MMDTMEEQGLGIFWDTCQVCQGEGSTDEHRPQHDDPDFCVVIKCEACGGSGWEQIQ